MKYDIVPVAAGLDAEVDVDIELAVVDVVLGGNLTVPPATKDARLEDANVSIVDSRAVLVVVALES